MAIGRMPKGTTKFVRRIQQFTRKPSLESEGKRLLSGADGEAKRLKSTNFSQLPEVDRLFYLTGKRSPGVPKQSVFGKLPGDIPHGCLAVYVGMQRRRYVISTKILNHTLFKQLLKKSEEEFGFEYEGGLNVACDPSFFEHLLWLIITKNKACSTDLEDVLDIYDCNAF